MFEDRYKSCLVKDDDYFCRPITSRCEYIYTYFEWQGSKTLTRSSVLLAFHTVLGNITTVDRIEADGNTYSVIVPSEYKGPKAIGQIFGISYIYSVLWKLGLIEVPEKVEAKLKGKRCKIELN